MDLADTTARMQQASQRYLHWRRTLAELRESAGNAPVRGSLARDCEALLPGSALGSAGQALEALEALTPEIKGALREARKDAWYEQGKVLRYALVVVENRVATLAEELAGHTGEDVRPLLRSLETHAASLRGAIAGHDKDPGAQSRVCSSLEIEALIADDNHIADKEHLERVAERARAAELAETQACIHLAWDPVTGDVRRAALIPSASRSQERSAA